MVSDAGEISIQGVVSVHRDDVFLPQLFVDVGELWTRGVIEVEHTIVMYNLQGAHAIHVSGLGASFDLLNRGVEDYCVLRGVQGN